MPQPEKANDMTYGTPWKRIILFFIPLFLGNIIQQLYNAIDAIIAGHFIGPEALAAVGANMPIVQIAVSLFFGISTGAGVLISQNFGARNYEELSSVVDTFMILIYTSSIFMGALGIIFAKNLYALINTPPEILSYSFSYMRIILLGAIFPCSYFAISSILQATGDTKTPLVLFITSSVLNIILDIIFVTILKMGIQSLAIATIISQSIALIFVIIYINKKSEIIRLHFLKSSFRCEVLKDIVKIGFPSSIFGIFFSISMFALQSLVNNFGFVVMAGYNAAIRIDLIATQTAQNFGYSLSTFIGQNVGAGKWDRVKNGVKSSIIMAVITSTIISAVIIVFGRAIIMLFTTDKNVIDAGYGYLIVVAPFYIIAAYFFTMINGIRGAGDTLTPMIIGISVQVVLRVLIAYIFININHSPKAIWISEPLAWILGSVIITVYYFSGKWKNYVRVKQFKVKINNE